MASNAQAYDELSKPQFEAGSQFICELSLNLGDKVLDMGCGTGNLTKYSADIVGPDGLVYGIDPDATRIKIAEEKHKEVSNLHFHVGNSVTGFPHDNESYYDVHISTFTLHWLPNDEKKIYIQKVYRSLKPGGKLAILTGSKTDRDNSSLNLHPLDPDGLRKIFADIGVFTDVLVEECIYPAHFEKYELLKRWFKASFHRDLDELDPVYVKAIMADCVTMHDDGSVTAKLPCIRIVASKESLSL